MPPLSLLKRLCMASILRGLSGFPPEGGGHFQSTICPITIRAPLGRCDLQLMKQTWKNSPLAGGCSPSGPQPRAGRAVSLRLLPVSSASPRNPADPRLLPSLPQLAMDTPGTLCVTSLQSFDPLYNTFFAQNFLFFFISLNVYYRFTTFVSHCRT